MADVRRLAELGMVPELAKEVAKQMESGSNADNISVPAFTGGGVTFPGGTLTEALQAIADATT